VIGLTEQSAHDWPSRHLTGDKMEQQTDLFTVKEYHHDGPSSEKQSHNRRLKSRENKCYAVLEIVEILTGMTAGEFYSGKSKDDLQLKGIYDIYDIRRQLYILKKKQLIRQGRVRICSLLGVNTVTWHITLSGRIRNASKKQAV